MSCKCKMMGAGYAGSTKYNSSINLNQGGGNKKQGITSRVALNNWSNRPIQIKSNGIGKERMFHMNQLGGIGKHRSMFLTNARGVFLPIKNTSSPLIEDIPITLSEPVNMTTNLIRTYNFTELLNGTNTLFTINVGDISSNNFYIIHIVQPPDYMYSLDIGNSLSIVNPLDSPIVYFPLSDGTIKTIYSGETVSFDSSIQVNMLSNYISQSFIDTNTVTITSTQSGRLYLCLSVPHATIYITIKYLINNTEVDSTTLNNNSSDINLEVVPGDIITVIFTQLLSGTIAYGYNLTDITV